MPSGLTCGLHRRAESKPVRRCRPRAANHQGRSINRSPTSSRYGSRSTTSSDRLDLTPISADQRDWHLAARVPDQKNAKYSQCGRRRWRRKLADVCCTGLWVTAEVYGNRSAQNQPEIAAEADLGTSTTLRTYIAYVIRVGDSQGSARCSSKHCATNILKRSSPDDCDQNPLAFEDASRPEIAKRPRSVTNATSRSVCTSSVRDADLSFQPECAWKGGGSG